MNALLERILEAHGGTLRWNRLAIAQATIVTGGSLWARKGLLQDAAPRRMTVALHRQRASVTPFGAPDQFTAYSPGRIAIENSAGKVVAERRDPRAAFAGHTMDTPWDPLHRAYFNGYALWTYLTIPFLLAMEGVAVEELAPWPGEDGPWQRLRATFPASIATHGAVQDFYFDAGLRLRRHDYQLDVAGGFAAAQYVSDYTEADGIWLPATRRAYARKADNQPEREALLVAIDLSEIRFGQH